MPHYILNDSPSMEKDPENLHILCLGDVVGRAGRHHLRDHLAKLRNTLSLDMVIANGENAAGGLGLTKEAAGELFSAGVDIITSGNHIWKHSAFIPYLQKEPRILRPANYAAGAAGQGFCIHTLKCGTKVAVINLLGRTFMEAVDCPFRKAEEIIASIPDEVSIRILDFHAEATSEKRAMVHFLDGKLSAVLGTHTHVQTADAMISELGTASLTDLGMCGVEQNSVLGVNKKAVIERFYTGLPISFTPAKDKASLNGALLVLKKVSGKTLFIALVRDNVPHVWKR